MATKERPTHNVDHLASYIDHTLLRADATVEEIKGLCLEAKQYQFYSVCINPSYVTQAKELLMMSPVKVCTVIGFPLGATETQVKAFEAQCAVDQGADELDMVLHIGALKSQNLDLVRADIRAVVENAQQAPVKVILETHLLSNEEKILGCRLAMDAGAHFVKTSTGFTGGGATLEDIALMRKVVGPDFGVKASGGVRDFATAVQMIQAGANRIGTSSGVQILSSSEAKPSGRPTS